MAGLRRRFRAAAKLQPAPEGFLAFVGLAPGQQTSNTDILIQFRPMNTFPTANEAPGLPFRRSAMKEPREPSEGHGDSAAVDEVHGERIIGNRHRSCG